jgi:hypothetical protein
MDSGPRRPWQDEDPVAWTAIGAGLEVRAADGTPVGRVTHPLGDESEDIFDGLGFRTLHAPHRLVMAKSDLVAALTRTAAYLTIAPDEVQALPPYAEEDMRHIGPVGRFFRHREGWIRDQDKEWD